MPNAVLLKGAVHLVSSLGVQRVLGQVIKNNTVVVSTADKILLSTGSFVLGSMLVEQTHNHIKRVFDMMKDDIQESTAEDENTSNE